LIHNNRFATIWRQLMKIPLIRAGSVLVLCLFLILSAGAALADPGNGNGWGQGVGGGQDHKDAPELDPGSLGCALTLLAGGFMILKDRIRQK
jgi:hypothetical protein